MLATTDRDDTMFLPLLRVPDQARNISNATTTLFLKEPEKKDKQSNQLTVSKLPNIGLSIKKLIVSDYELRFVRETNSNWKFATQQSSQARFILNMKYNLLGLAKEACWFYLSFAGIKCDENGNCSSALNESAI